MLLYRWRSECLKNYGLGTIIVMAESVEKAREIALENFNQWYVERYSWFDMGNEYDREDYMDKKAEFLDDIAKEPTTDDCIFIEGSD